MIASGECGRRVAGGGRVTRERPVHRDGERASVPPDGGHAGEDARDARMGVV